MNPENNELMLVEEVNKLPDKIRDKFLQVPKELAPDAEAVLNEQLKIIVTRKTQSGRNLISWAKREKKRRDNRKKKKLSRRKNRNK